MSEAIHRVLSFISMIWWMLSPASDAGLLAICLNTLNFPVKGSSNPNPRFVPTQMFLAWSMHIERTLSPGKLCGSLGL